MNLMMADVWWRRSRIGIGQLDEFGFQSYVECIVEESASGGDRVGDLGGQWGTVLSTILGGGDGAAYIPQDFNNI